MGACYCQALNVYGKLQSRLKFAVQVFNITIGGRHGISLYKDGTALLDKFCPGKDGPIMVEANGFSNIGKAIQTFTPTQTPRRLHGQEYTGPKRTQALSLVEQRYSSKGVTNAFYFGNQVATIMRQLLTTQASEVTARLLGVQVGEVAWPGALFGAASNLHPAQNKFLEFDWIRMCAADGDSARWKPGVDDRDDSSKTWVARPLSDPNAFGDGKLFSYVMNQVQDKWRLVGACLTMTYETLDPEATDQDVERAATKWLKAEYKSLNMTDLGLTFASEYIATIYVT